MSTLPPLSLNPALDATGLARRFAAEGRVQIADFLPPDVAQAWHAMLRGRSEWVQVVNSGEKLFELSREVRADMDARQRDALDQAVYAGARDGF